MQTLSVRIENDFMGEFMSYIEKFKDKIHLQRDENLEYDPYFYERKERLNRIDDGVKNGDTVLLSIDEFEQRSQALETKLAAQYGD